ncbi:hypothetical protein T440DRAFT_469687 [Plenodomus tracheiphilus IPT5]|uniref:Secreted protein n=1 Tax=Plenodomus tracheiphilus IPT5 TaxID=1408161 RepID=A0A6A7B3K5_9PLEO|nr:hypothetical protein T440DRAFT_469687 [Plenodomus tracheiphilus IPT5]
MAIFHSRELTRIYITVHTVLCTRLLLPLLLLPTHTTTTHHHGNNNPAKLDATQKVPLGNVYKPRLQYHRSIPYRAKAASLLCYSRAIPGSLCVV